MSPETKDTLQATVKMITLVAIVVVATVKITRVWDRAAAREDHPALAVRRAIEGYWGSQWDTPRLFVAFGTGHKWAYAAPMYVPRGASFTVTHETNDPGNEWSVKTTYLVEQ
jgi:hypothetical protein